MGVRGKTGHFLVLNANISKTVGDTSKVSLLLIGSRVGAYMRFLLTLPKERCDLELL